MADSISRLKAALTRKERGMEDMLRVLEEEQSCLVGFDVDGLARVGQLKQETMAAMEECNLECRAAMGDAEASLGLPAGGNLSELISRLERSARFELKAAQERLLAAAGRIDEAIALNRGLLESASGLVDRSMSLFSKLFTPPPVYGERGVMAERPAEARIIRAEI